MFLLESTTFKFSELSSIISNNITENNHQGKEERLFSLFAAVKKKKCIFIKVMCKSQQVHSDLCARSKSILIQHERQHEFMHQSRIQCAEIRLQSAAISNNF